MKSQPNNYLKDTAQTNAAAIRLIPKQDFLALQVTDDSVKFDRAVGTGVLKWLSQEMLLAYEKESGTAKAVCWKLNGVFALEEQWLRPIPRRQPNFLIEALIQYVFNEAKCISIITNTMIPTIGKLS